MLYREIIAVCSQIHKITLCGQNLELLNVKLVVHIVTTGLHMANREHKLLPNLRQHTQNNFSVCLSPPTVLNPTHIDLVPRTPHICDNSADNATCLPTWSRRCTAHALLLLLSTNKHRQGVQQYDSIFYFILYVVYSQHAPLPSVILHALPDHLNTVLLVTYTIYILYVWMWCTPVCASGTGVPYFSLTAVWSYHILKVRNLKIFPTLRQ
jgi:hypothetical protein